MVITDEELNAITKAIYTRYGIDFTNYEPVSLKRRISRIIDQFDLESSIGLWRKLIYEKDFIHIFIEEVTVGLTEMFRNHDFWIKIRDEVLPHFAYQKNLSIWHAGCSTGEEVYSMAICLTEEEMIGKTSVTSTDLNRKSVTQAKEGTFPTIYKRQYTKNYEAAKGRNKLQNYYHENPETLTFSKLDMRNFKFDAHNLTKDPVYKKNDIVFCRNVMIYFDDTLKMKVVKSFHDSLNDGGFFAIGYYDSLPEDAKRYFKAYDQGRKIYRKVG
jgi:chemotaxis protein methyltransferase CheR